MNPMAIMQMKGLIDQFRRNHPKVPMFFSAASQSVKEGSIIEITVTDSDGKKLCTNMRITQDDLKLIEQLKTMSL